MATPIFNTSYNSVAPFHGLPKTAQTGLFIHRIKSAAKPKAPGQTRTAHGHPVIHAPVVVRPSRPVHTSPGTGLFNFKAPAGL